MKSDHCTRRDLCLGLCAGALAPLVGGRARSADEAPPAIDRHALVARHDIRWDDLEGVVPLGNGEFCVGVDATGLQTFGGSILTHWGWHSCPLPEGCTDADVPPTGTRDEGRITGPMRVASGRADLDSWLFHNPHPANLARLRFVLADGVPLPPNAPGEIERTYELWTGTHTARYIVEGDAVEVRTWVHPDLDLVAVRVDSELLREGRVAIHLEFPYPNADGVLPWAGKWDWPDAHTSETQAAGPRRVQIARQADELAYAVSVEWSEGCAFRPEEGLAHAFRLTGSPTGVSELVCHFGPTAPAKLPDVTATAAASAARWERFWSTGGAIDLSGSADPRWPELERRIVLSQYEMAVQSAGSWPSAETGLLGIDPWASQFHMEMVWWHLAHYGLWGRWEMAERALGCYERFLPIARQLATQLGYEGAKWGKQVGPEGRTATWVGSFVLHWQQPHPIFFAELEYRLRPSSETLARWREIVFDTARYMADFPTQDEAGVYHLRPVMAACEEPTSYDTVFELAYWRYGLGLAQLWRERLGLPREPKWDAVLSGLAPLPTHEGLYVLSPERTDAHGGSHPDAIGVFGMLPPLEGVDRATAKATLLHMAETWDCIGWGWDFPWFAMAAARHGEPELAIEALLHPSGQNHYDRRGVNTGGPCPYLPGNGGVLYAVAMMAAGWDGAPEVETPGFPKDGSWVVRWEGLAPAP